MIEPGKQLFQNLPSLLSYYEGDRWGPLIYGDYCTPEAQCELQMQGQERIDEAIRFGLEHVNLLLALKHDLVGICETPRLMYDEPTCNVIVKESQTWGLAEAIAWGMHKYGHIVRARTGAKAKGK